MNDAPSALAQICIQVHSALAPGLDMDRLAKVAEQLARSTEGVRGFEVVSGEDEGALFVNIVMACEDPILSWQRLRPALLESPEFGAPLKAASLWLCTGEEGWDDYLLLYHYDPAVEVDNSAAS